MEQRPNDKDLQTFLEAQEKIQFKQNWRTLVQEHEKQAPQAKIKRYNFRHYAIAASIALVLGLGMYWMVTNSDNSPKTTIALANNYDTAVSKPHLNALQSGQKEASLQAITKAYAKEDYAQTIKLINSYTATTPSNKALEIRAYCYYKSGDYKNAIADFELFIKNGQHSFDDALWFSALSYLKMTPPETNKAKQSLLQLIETYDAKDEIAQKLLNELERIKSKK